MTERSEIQKSFLPVGFALIILLMTLLTVIGVNRMQQNNKLMEEIVTQNNVKIELVRNMYIFARERSVVVLRMMVTDDPFEQDELSLELDRLAAQFIKARNELKQKKLDDYEKTHFDQHTVLTQWVAPLQRQVADLIIEEELDEAREILLEKAIPGQDQVLAELEKILAYERLKAKEALSQANNIVSDATTFMAVLAFSVIAISFVIAVFVIQKSHRNQRLLIDARDKL
ncbi:MAG: hypothetical protein EP297_06130, partial [Gammaproteobacteria bacterium]